MATNITIADAQATPVNHVFVPMGLDENKTFWWEDQSQTNALGYWRLGISLKRPPAGQAGTSSEKRNFVAKVVLLEPVLANITNSTVSGVAPAPTLAYVTRSYHEYYLPEQGALLDRQNISKMAPLALQNAQIKQVIETLVYPGT